MLTEAGKSFYRDAQYILQYCSDSIERAKKAMQDNGNVIRIGTSPMTPAQPLVYSWSKLQEKCPEIKFRLVPFVNTIENARRFKESGTEHRRGGGIFDETMLNLRQCAGLEISREPICCAVSLQHPLAKRKF